MSKVSFLFPSNGRDSSSLVNSSSNLFDNDISGESLNPQGGRSLRQVALALVTNLGKGANALKAATQSRFQRILSEQELIQRSGLPQCGDRAAQLLAGYFRKDLSRVDGTELVGVLAFSQSAEGAQLLSRDLLELNSAADRQKLQAHALFPGLGRAADLLYLDEHGESPLSREERAELCGLRWHPHDPKQARKVGAMVSKCQTEIARNSADESKVTRLVLEYVRRELRERADAVSTVAELARLFELSQAGIEKALGSSEDGLDSKELALREQKSELVAEERKFALPLARRRALMTLVSVENEMHRSGLIDSLSSGRELAQFFAIGDKELRKTLRLLPPEDFRYRRSLSSHGEDQQRFDTMVRDVKNEIGRDRSNRGGSLRSDSAIASEYEIDPIVVFHYLREGLSPAESSWRDQVLRLKLGEDPHRQNLIKFVSLELKAFDEAEITRMTPDRELASIFGVPESRIGKLLKAPGSGLEPGPGKFREYVLKNQSSREAFSEALRQIRLMQTRESVARHITGTLDQELHQGEIRYQGLHFCSFAEAACGMLLEKYLRSYGFRLVEGETFQIQLGKYSIDFLVKTPERQIFVEYHPIMMKRALPKARLGGFGNYDEYQALKNSLPRSKQADFARQVQEMLYREYSQRRKDLVDEHPLYSGTPLRTVTSARDLYYLFKYVFDVPLPAEQQFTKEFSTLRRRIIKAQKEIRKPLPLAA